MIHSFHVGRLHVTLIHTSVQPRHPVGGMVERIHGAVLTTIQIGCWYLNSDWL